MTPSEIYGNARAQFVETSAAFITDAELRFWLWQALYELSNKIECIQTTDSTTTTVASTASYSRPTNCIKILRVTWDSVKLKKIDMTQYDAVSQQGYGSTPAEGNPVYYYEWGNNITLYPTPGSAETLKFWYTKRPTQLTSSNDSSSTVIDVPEQFQFYTIDYLLYRMYLKEDNRKADVHMNLWEDHKRRAREEWEELRFNDQYLTVKDENNFPQSEFGIS